MPYNKRFPVPSATTVSSMARNDDLEAACADPDHAPKPTPFCWPHRLTAVILVQAVGILGLLAAFARTRVRCDTAAAVAAEMPDRCNPWAYLCIVSYEQRVNYRPPPRPDLQHRVYYSKHRRMNPGVFLFGQCITPQPGHSTLKTSLYSKAHFVSRRVWSEALLLLFFARVRPSSLRKHRTHIRKTHEEIPRPLLPTAARFAGPEACLPERSEKIPLTESVV